MMMNLIFQQFDYIIEKITFTNPVNIIYVK